VSHENRTSIPAADLESHLANDADATQAPARFNSPVNIHVHSTRKRLADADGISAKAAIDGLIHAKILRDDSPKFVQSVTFSQEQGAEEKTVITITEAMAEEHAARTAGVWNEG